MKQPRFHVLPGRDVLIASDQEVEGLQLAQLGQVTGQSKGHQEATLLRL